MGIFGGLQDGIGAQRRGAKQLKFGVERDHRGRLRPGRMIVEELQRTDPDDPSRALLNEFYRRTLAFNTGGTHEAADALKALQGAFYEGGQEFIEGIREANARAERMSQIIRDGDLEKLRELMERSVRDIYWFRETHGAKDERLSRLYHDPVIMNFAGAVDLKEMGESEGVTDMIAPIIVEGAEGTSIKVLILEEYGRDELRRVKGAILTRLRQLFPEGEHYYIDVSYSGAIEQSWSAGRLAESLNPELKKELDLFGARLAEHHPLDMDKLISVDLFDDGEPERLKFELDQRGKAPVLKIFAIMAEGDRVELHQVENPRTTPDGRQAQIKVSDLFLATQMLEQKIRSRASQRGAPSVFASENETLGIIFDLSWLNPDKASSESFVDLIIPKLLEKFGDIYDRSDGRVSFRVIGGRPDADRDVRTAAIKKWGQGQDVVTLLEEGWPEKLRADDKKFRTLSILNPETIRIRTSIRIVPVLPIFDESRDAGIPAIDAIIEFAVFAGQIDLDDPAQFNRAKAAFEDLLGRSIGDAVFRGIMDGTADWDTLTACGIPPLERVPLDLWIRYMQTAARMSAQSA